MSTFICSSCKIEKELNTDNFSKKKRNKHGYSYSCKDCQRIKRKEYYENNKESINKTKKKWIESNKEKQKEYSRKYYQKNKEKIKKNMSEWNKENKDKNRATKQRRRAREAEVENTLTESQWRQTLEFFGYRCAYCVKSEDLQQEHVFPLYKGGGYTQENIVPSCYKCNYSKGIKDMFTWYTNYESYSLSRMADIEDYQMNFGNIRKVKVYYLDGF